MIINNTTYEQIIKNLAKFLDTYSGINPNLILNKDSIRGTNLSVIISNSKAYSPNAGTEFLLFELLENPNDENFITKDEGENEMMTIQNYDFHIIVYGNKSGEFAQKISAIFKQSDDALLLRDLGIYVHGVSPITSENEFINNTYILRKDLIIKLQVRYKFENIGQSVEYFAEDQDISPIIKVASKANIN